MPSNSRHHRSLAFTLIEILVVISIFVLLLAIAVPAFSAMLYSSEQSLAEQSLKSGLNTARDFAARSPVGQDAAAVFVYDRESKRTSIVVCTKAGVLTDIDRSNTTAASRPTVVREVFAPAPGVEPIQMTSGWTVRGYAPAYTIDDEWYETTYAGGTLRSQGHWLFPETSFFDDINNRADGLDRQSFMIRFEGGTGLVKATDLNASLVLMPSPGTTFRSNWPPLGSYVQTNNPLNVENEGDGVRFVKRVLAWPSFGPAPTISLQTKQQILGDESSDTILVKSVGQFALCNENRLAKALGIRVDDSTGCIYQDPFKLTPAGLPGPVFVQRLGSPFGANDIADLDAWIEGHLTDTAGDPIDSDCRIFTVQRYLGWLQEVTGTINGQGVGS